MVRRGSKKAAGPRLNKKWVQLSASLLGGSKKRSIERIAASATRKGKQNIGSGYGGHFRAVQGFRYLGAR